jgi:hypothetical protein
MVNYVFYPSTYLAHYLLNEQNASLSLSHYAHQHPKLSGKTYHLLFIRSLKNLYHCLKPHLALQDREHYYYLYRYFLQKLIEQAEHLMHNHKIHLIDEDCINLTLNNKSMYKFRALSHKLEQEAEQEELVIKYNNLKNQPVALKPLAQFISQNESLSPVLALHCAQTIHNYHKQNFKESIINNEQRHFDFFKQHKIDKHNNRQLFIASKEGFLSFD